MRVYVYHTIGMIVCVALQSAWPMWLGVSGCFPDLVLALTLVTGLARGPQEGFTVGFIGAFLLGSTSQSPEAVGPTSTFHPSRTTRGLSPWRSATARAPFR